MKRLSIGMFTYSTRPRGSVVHAACLAEALHERGHQVTLYALDKDGEGFFRPLHCNLALVPAGKASPDMEQLVGQRIAELSHFLTALRSQHDILHAQDCLVASGLLAARSEGLAGLICRTVHHVERFESPYLEHCQERSICASDLCLSVSRATGEDVLASYGRTSLQVNNGVDYRRFHDVPASEALQFRVRHGLAPEVPLVVSIGGVEERKNTLLMLEAFELALQVRPTLRWLIAGGASIFEHQQYRSAFEARLAASPESVQRAVLRLGVLPESELPSLLCAADVLLHASLHEGFGLCVLEALAAGARVVVSRGAPFDEYLDDGCCVRVHAREADDVARGLLTALRPDPESVVRGQQRARDYSWQRSAARHEQIYTTAGEA